MLLRSLFEFLLPPWDLNPFQAKVILKALISKISSEFFKEAKLSKRNEWYSTLLEVVMFGSVSQYFFTFERKVQGLFKQWCRFSTGPTFRLWFYFCGSWMKYWWLPKWNILSNFPNDFSIYLKKVSILDYMFWNQWLG